jgi:quercetin dioxygenase-like cupin family protein
MAQSIDLNPLEPAGGVIEKKKVFESDEMKMMVFKMPAGSVIPAHSNPGVVQITVIEGKSSFLVGSGGVEHTKGSLIVYDRGEEHGMTAITDCVLLATIYH